MLQTPSGEDAAAEARSPAQWVAIGGALVVVLFLPLAVVAVWVGARLARGVEGAAAASVTALPIVLAFAMASTAAGAFVGRFGPRAGRGGAALAGALGGAVVVGIGALGRALSPWVVAVAATVALVGGGAVFALLGASLGRRLRRRGPRP